MWEQRSSNLLTGTWGARCGMVWFVGIGTGQSYEGILTTRSARSISPHLSNLVSLKEGWLFGEDMEPAIVRDVSCWESGGGVVLDLVTLKDGRVLAISDEVVILYRDINDLQANQPRERPTLLL